MDGLYTLVVVVSDTAELLIESGQPGIIFLRFLINPHYLELSAEDEMCIRDREWVDRRLSLSVPHHYPLLSAHGKSSVLSSLRNCPLGTDKPPLRKCTDFAGRYQTVKLREMCIRDSYMLVLTLFLLFLLFLSHKINNLSDTCLLYTSRCV